jgi:hypothetical protein
MSNHLLEQLAMFDVPKEYATIFTPGADLLSFPVHLQKESLEESHGAS